MNPLGLGDGPLVWIDCEMTGLDPKSDRIIEIAVLITNGNLDLVDEVGCHYVVKTDKQALDKMGEWCSNQHGKSGLTQQAIDSPHSPAEVAANVLEYVKRWIPEPRTGVLAGNSVHADAMFLREKGPDSEGFDKGIWSGIMEHLHYRNYVGDGIPTSQGGAGSKWSKSQLIVRWMIFEAQLLIHQPAESGPSLSTRATNPHYKNRSIRDDTTWLQGWTVGTTGLDAKQNRILEIAVLITNGNLDVVDEEGCHYIVKSGPEALKEMDEWCLNQHTKTGLVEASQASTHTPGEVASAVLEYIKRWVPEPRTAVLAGSSVHFDATFLRATGPDVVENGGSQIWNIIPDHLHYRIVGMHISSHV
ncbi:unnamed protein product [Rhizoctonia solani]|uniref:Exonuclease domain-containing protein n=1 Tax=Rhizoctonia solani TaxID=456999 RepID=A0A8H3HB92_9AGAM|nr:unnamed protein product [Rhizoctonia solani]